MTVRNPRYGLPKERTLTVASTSDSTAAELHLAMLG
jgi:hypothetical protein